MKTINRTSLAALLIANTYILSACGGGGGGSSDSTANLTLGLTDAPFGEAQSVTVAFDSITLQGPERTVIEFDEPMIIDLLDFQNGERIILLDEQELEPGEYQFIRLGVVEALSSIEVNGEVFDLTIPSGEQSGLQLNRGFTLGVATTSDFTIDFDVRRSVVRQGNGEFRLRPTLRLVDSLAVENVSGVIDENFILDPACNNGDNNDIGNAVYLFEGSDIMPQDLQNNEFDPIASANVIFNVETSEFQYTIGFVPNGEYTVAFTCDAQLDDPSVDDLAAVNFPLVFNVVVPSN